MDLISMGPALGDAKDGLRSDGTREELHFT